MKAQAFIVQLPSIENIGENQRNASELHDGKKNIVVKKVACPRVNICSKGN